MRFLMSGWVLAAVIVMTIIVFFILLNKPL